MGISEAEDMDNDNKLKTDLGEQSNQSGPEHESRDQTKDESITHKITRVTELIKQGEIRIQEELRFTAAGKSKQQQEVEHEDRMKSKHQEATKKASENLIKNFGDFGEASGQLINLNKSGAFFGPHIDTAKKKESMEILHVNNVPLEDTYLGAPLFTNRSKIKCFDPMIQNLKNKLKGWKHKNLTTAGISTMIKSVTSSMSIYQMNCFRIPKTVIKNLNDLQRDFWWGKDIERPKGVYLKRWEAICKPKAGGGLGFQNINNFNTAMISKMGWRLKENPNTLWETIFKAKYYPETNVMHMDTKKKEKDSWIWKGIKSGIGVIQNNSLWIVGKGNNINIWKDYWIPGTNPPLDKKNTGCGRYIKVDTARLGDSRQDGTVGRNYKWKRQRMLLDGRRN